MNNVKKLVVVASLLVLGGTGCGKSPSQYAAERVAEKAIEKQTGGQVKIDTGNKTVKYDTNQATYQGGENVQLPSEFPKDVYVPEGKLVSAIVNKQNGLVTISLENPIKAQDLAKMVENKLKSDGWKIVTNMNFGDTYSYIAEKDTRQTSVMLGGNGNMTNTVISVGKKSVKK